MNEYLHILLYNALSGNFEGINVDIDELNFKKFYKLCKHFFYKITVFIVFVTF